MLICLYIISPGMTELLKSKLPPHLHNYIIVFGMRYSPEELLKERLVSRTYASDELLTETIKYAATVTSKGRFHGDKYRQTMHAIKCSLYKPAYQSLADGNNIKRMGFESSKWDSLGRSKF